MNSRIQKFVIVRLPFRLACACAPMVAFAAAACAPPTEGASNHTAPSATAANALRAADVGLEYETWQRGGGEAPESFAGYAARVRAGSDAEHATWAASKLPVDPDNAGAQNVVRARDVHDLVRRAAAEPDRVFTVMAHVPEPDFDWPEFRRRDISDESREEMRSAREGQVAEAVAELEGSVVREGGELRSRFWLIPAFEFVASGATVLRIAALPGYTVMHEVLPVDIKPMEGYDGVELRSGTQVASMISSGYRGQAGGRTGGAVRVAIAEGDVLLGHPGYKRPNSTSRLVAQYECDDTSCFAPTHFLDANGHGNSVTRIAAGSIEGGQDALVPLATDRVQRSGIAPETNIYHVMVAPNTTGWTGHAKMVEKMTSIGADVANHSYGAGCGAGSYCADATMEAALHNSHLAGVLHVAAAGNDPTEICYPAASRDVIAVGALDSNDGTAYATSDMSPISGTGGVAIITAGNYHTGPVAIVDLAAPGNADFWYGKTGATYNYWHDPGLIGYTSFATPVVTGAGALFKQAVSSIAWDASLARVNMLLMGDGWSKATNARRTTLMDTRSGAGRLHVQAPGMSSLGGNWGWFSTRQSLTHHQLYSKTVKIGGGTSIPAGTTQLKVAVTFTNQNFSDSDDIDISIVDTCPPGGGVVTVASDTSYDVRSRISLRQSETALVGRCLRLDVYAYTAVSTASVDIAYYYHSGNPDLHLRAA